MEHQGWKFFVQSQRSVFRNKEVTSLIFKPHLMPFVPDLREETDEFHLQMFLTPQQPFLVAA